LRFLPIFILNNKGEQNMEPTKSINTTLTRTYYNMLTRCYNENCGRHWEYYGGKGVRVCKQWRKSKEAFITWALANGYQDGLQIDRIDGDRDYKPSNARWVTAQRNSANRCGTKPFNRRHQLPRNVYAADKQFMVRFKRCSQIYYVGCFNTIRQAVIARNAAIQHFAI
jgi:hypothetical protein